jgi:hypothetical protein
MSTSNRQDGFSIMEKLAEVHLTASQRAQTLSALKIAESVVEFFAGLMHWGHQTPGQGARSQA